MEEIRSQIPTMAFKPTTRQAVELLDNRLNQIDGKFKTLEKLALKENDNIRKCLDDQRAAEEEAHASLESRIEALEGKFMGMLEAMNSKVKELEKVIQQGRHATPAVEWEARIEAPKPPIFKGVRDAQEVENFLWHLEKYFKCNKVSNDDTKINLTVLYLTEMAMLWWRRMEDEIGKGLCTINTWEQFKMEFKKTFYPNNAVYETKKRLSELKQTSSMKAYIEEFTRLTLQIPNLTEEDMLFNFMDGLQSWVRMELERRQVSTFKEAITQAESLTYFKKDRGKAKETRSSHAKGGVDHGKGKERGCYICGGPHGYARCPIRTIIRDYEKEAQY